MVKYGTADMPCVTVISGVAAIGHHHMPLKTKYYRSLLNRDFQYLEQGK
jgi:hypothetical protein